LNARATPISFPFFVLRTLLQKHRDGTKTAIPISELVGVRDRILDL